MIEATLEALITLVDAALIAFIVGCVLIFAAIVGG